MNSSAINDVPLATLSPTYESKAATIHPQTAPNEQTTTEQYNDSSLRLRGGAGCLTDFLAAIGCCCICEDCCC
ncbi:unnamed protein product [Rhizopus stolonifer]